MEAIAYIWIAVIVVVIIAVVGLLVVLVRSQRKDRDPAETPPHDDGYQAP